MCQEDDVSGGEQKIGDSEPSVRERLAMLNEEDTRAPGPPWLDDDHINGVRSLVSSCLVFLLPLRKKVSGGEGRPSEGTNHT